METRKHIAAEKKRCNSHNCAQAILHTYADVAGISEDDAMNIDDHVDQLMKWVEEQEAKSQPA